MNQYRSLFDELNESGPVQEVETPSGIRLRPYQCEAVESVFREWEADRCGVLVCLPTGTGKSVVFSEVMRQWTERNG